MAEQTWFVEHASSPERLETLLNELQDGGLEIFEVLSEGPREGFYFTVVARRPRLMDTRPSKQPFDVLETVIPPVMVTVNGEEVELMQDGIDEPNA